MDSAYQSGKEWTVNNSEADLVPTVVLVKLNQVLQSEMAKIGLLLEGLLAKGCTNSGRRSQKLGRPRHTSQQGQIFAVQKKPINERHRQW